MGPPAAYWAVREAEEGVTAKALGSGKIGTFGFVLRRLWRKYCRGVKDAREGMAAAEAEGAELREDEVEVLRGKVGHSAMVAGFRSNTFGGVYEKDGKLYILSLNTRTFRLCHKWGDWRGQGEKERRLPWMTETSPAAVRLGLAESEGQAEWTQRHLRFYWGSTNAPVEKARKWAVAEGYEEVI